MLNVVALVSGGKDSCYSALKCVEHGHKLVALANLYPSQIEEQRDSFMYQTQGFEVLPSIAECMGLPLERRAIRGSSVNQDLIYNPKGENDEVEDLYELLKDIKQKYPSINAVCSGAVLSNYQRTRVENVCERLGLTSLAYLWNRNQLELLDEMIEKNVKAVLVKACSFGLHQKHLGRDIESLRDYFVKLEKDFGFHVCGEGGEYETITLDCPLFTKGRIILDETSVITLEQRGDAPICCLQIHKHHVEPKTEYTDTINYERHLEHDSNNAIPQVMIETWDKIDQVHHQCDFVIGPFYGQTSQSVMKELLDAVEGQLDRISFVHLYLRDMNSFSEVNNAFQSLFTGKASIQPPSRATVELPNDGSFNVGVSAMVAKQARTVLQVRSRSEWAPQCIGPYSQCVQMDDALVFIAGQIPLEPSTMNLVKVDLRTQLSLAMRHCYRVSHDRTMNGTRAVTAIIYVSTHRSKDDPNSFIEQIGSALKELLQDPNDNAVLWVLDAKVIVVAVPMLPKNANVEVEVVATTVNSKATAEAIMNDASKSTIENHHVWSRCFYDITKPSKGISGGASMIVPVLGCALWNAEIHAPVSSTVIHLAIDLTSQYSNDNSDSE